MNWDTAQVDNANPVIEYRIVYGGAKKPYVTVGYGSVAMRMIALNAQVLGVKLEYLQQDRNTIVTADSRLIDLLLHVYNDHNKATHPEMSFVEFVE